MERTLKMSIKTVSERFLKKKTKMTTIPFEIFMADMFNLDYDSAWYMLVIWQPYEKMRPDEMATYFNLFGKVLHIKDWWRREDGKLELPLQIVKYSSKESVSKAEVDMHMRLPHVYAMSLMRLLFIAGCAELCTSSPSRGEKPYLEVTATPKLKEHLLLKIVDDLQTYGVIYHVLKEKESLIVFYKYATNGLAAQLLLDGSSASGMSFRISLKNSATFIEKTKKCLRTYFEGVESGIKIPYRFNSGLQYRRQQESTPAPAAAGDEEEIYIFVHDEPDEGEEQEDAMDELDDIDESDEEQEDAMDELDDIDESDEEQEDTMDELDDIDESDEEQEDATYEFHYIDESDEEQEDATYEFHDIDESDEEQEDATDEFHDIDESDEEQEDATDEFHDIDESDEEQEDATDEFYDIDESDEIEEEG